MPERAELWSLTSLREKLIKIGGKVVSHGRYVTFQMAEVAVPRKLFGPAKIPAAVCASPLPWRKAGKGRIYTPDREPSGESRLMPLSSRRVPAGPSGPAGPGRLSRRS